MQQPKHRYRATIYFGKEIWEDLDRMSKQFGISVATLATIIFKTGFEMSKSLDRKEDSKDGK